MGKAKPDPCPECGAPTSINGTFCKACGWDGSLQDTEDSYLDGVDVPQGYAPDEEEPAPTAAKRGLGILGTILILLALAGFVATAVL